MVIKRVPGAGEAWMVYDIRDRLVLTQDSSLRSKGQWLYTSYDSLNRPILTGLWTSSYNRLTQKSYADTALIWPVPTSGTYAVLTRTHYDDYSWVSGTGSGLSSSLITTYTANTSYFYAASDVTFPYPRAITSTNATRGLVTGSDINVLNTTTYLYNVSFYDDRGRLIQAHSTNNSGGKDTVTTQYDFTGRILRVLQNHGKAGVNTLNYVVLTKNAYDAAGRLISLTKKVGTSLEDTLAVNSYDELGRLSLKKLGRSRTSLTNYAYTANPIDTLRYAYNIRGWIRGINKDYSNAANGAINWFGMELNYDYGFSQSQLNGNIAGIKWRNKGDGLQRAYGFTYDPVNRLTQADFTQYTGSTWNTSGGIDFTTRGITYDQNSNILTMNQVGLRLNTVAVIDSLLYGYNTNSNKISYVTDRQNDTATLLGDFKEYNTGTATDYSYDGNGNLTLDNNKRIANIHYNHLNLPDSITFTGKGYIKYVYDAAGVKQQKITIDNTITKKTVTSYIGSFVYQYTTTNLSGTAADTLQFILEEEGRIRPRAPGKSDTVSYDFFEKDHLGNTRVVLTDEVQQDTYPAATLENSSASMAVEQTYYTINLADTISTSRIASWSATTGNNYPNNNGNPPYNTNPNSNTSATSAIVYKLNGATGDKTGLGITLKVMSGDIVSIYGKSFWHNGTGSNPSNTYLINAALNSFISAFAGTSAVAGSGKGATATALQNSTPTYNGVNSWVTSGVPNPGLSTVPRAYINWILFNDQFVPVASNCGYDLVNTTADAVKTHTATVSISTSGYLYVYCSNESNLDVLFDNLQLVHTRGPLLETTDYYPFGLTMAGISDKALKSSYQENKYKFNEGTELANKEFSDGSGLELYTTVYRMYDAQLGRFWLTDPLADLTTDVSPYAFALNNPVLRNDPTGLKDSAQTLKPVVVTAKTKPLKDGPYNGQAFRNIVTVNQLSPCCSYNVTKIAMTNEKAIEYLNKSSEDLEKLAKQLEFVSTLLGGSVEMKSIQEIKEWIKLIKEGKIKMPSPVLIGAIAMSLEGMKSENGAKEIKGIVIAYIELHSTAVNPNPTPANGIYIIQSSSSYGGPGGGSYTSSTSYYDITTKQYLGGTKSY
jgi:RHS repeat-associated protein